MTDLSKLQPSTALGPIPADVLRTHPLGGLYVWVWPSEINDIIRVLEERSAGWYRYEAWDDDRGEWEWRADEDFSALWCAEGRGLHYIKCPNVSFSQTADAMRDGTKRVTRRRQPWPGCRVGSIFKAWAGTLRVPKEKRPDYLGTFRVSSIRREGRWLCPLCDTAHPDFLRSEGYVVKKCLWHGRQPMRDTLTPAEMALEGLPEMSGDEFWSLLIKLGAVGEDRRVCRIAFEEIR